jgi:hypothetical protein
MVTNFIVLPVPVVSTTTEPAHVSPAVLRLFVLLVETMLPLLALALTNMLATLASVAAPLLVEFAPLVLACPKLFVKQEVIQLFVPLVNLDVPCVLMVTTLTELTSARSALRK